MTIICSIRFWGALLGLILVQSTTFSAGKANRAAVFYEPLPGQDRAFANELAAWARNAGYAPEMIGLNVLTNASVLRAEKYGVLILPNARRLPAAATASIESFLKSGGNLLALGVPAWKPGLFPVGQQWLSRGDYEELVSRQKTVSIIEDFEHADITQWRRASNERDAQTRWELAGSGQGKALHVTVENYSGWDTLGSPTLTSPFPDGHTLTCVRAKGAPQTRQLALEWTEQDGSRWIATINLSTNWKQYALAPEAFKPWEPRAGRGGPQDRFNPRKAARFTVGIAMTHTTISGRQHEYWLDDLGSAPNPFQDTIAPGYVNHPHLEAFCPDYLFYPVTTPVYLKSPKHLALTASCQLAKPIERDLYALHPRPQGTGYDQGRPWRWQPLLEAQDANGDYRGAIGALVAHFNAPFTGGTWATFTPDDPQFYRQAEVSPVVQETLRSLRRGLLLKDGGSEFFTVFENQSFRLGATVANLGQDINREIHLKIQVQSADGQNLLFSHEWQTNVPARASMPVEQIWKPVSWPAEGCMVTVELRQGNQLIDRLTHELNVWKPKAKPNYISVAKGEFRLDGQLWKAHGVNYMPSTDIGLGGDYFEHWIGRGAYDPEVIQRDLQRIKAMGLNSVSIFIYFRSLQAQHLLDFLRRCEQLGLKVNQSLRPGTPMEFRWKEMKALIEHFRLVQNDTVFAYDLAWEPSHYDYNYQSKNYQALWNQWVVKRHGSVAQAEAAWKLSAPRQDNGLSVPKTEQLFKDGPWRKMTADYRAFLDELLQERYAEARRLVKSIDPNHPVSFRMQFAGDPTHTWGGLLPYDFYGLRQAVDIWEPEAYGRIGDWEKVKPGLFTAAYARLCDPAKPVLWAEMGNSVWDMQTMAPAPEKLAFTAQYYRDFYRMLIDSGADGIMFWWYPGGYRLNENSDYGIINPDGTDREITRVIRAEGAKFLSAPKPPPPNCWITVDRDRDARGLNGIYEAVKTEFWQAVGQGNVPGLKWQAAPGN